MFETGVYVKVQSAEFSQVTSKYIVMPQHANPSGVMFGGVLIGWMDMAAAMVAEKHSGTDVATVSIDKINFNSPIRVGDHVTVDAKLIATGKTSMKISVSVESETVKAGIKKQTTDAIFTFVAVDKSMKPCHIPKLEESN